MRFLKEIGVLIYFVIAKSKIIEEIVSCNTKRHPAEFLKNWDSNVKISIFDRIRDCLFDLYETFFAHCVKSKRAETAAKEKHSSFPYLLH